MPYGGWHNFELENWLHITHQYPLYQLNLINHYCSLTGAVVFVIAINICWFASNEMNSIDVIVFNWDKINIQWWKKEYHWNSGRFQLVSEYYNADDIRSTTFIQWF